MYKEQISENMFALKQLDKYLKGHYGFIAGGVFKNILSKEPFKDVDIFFECREDYEMAVEKFDYKQCLGKVSFLYENDKVKAYILKETNVRIEFIKSIFGTPEEILDNFDFTVAKFAYYAEGADEEVIYKALYHEDFFEHLHNKRLVLDNKIPFPVSTWERSYRYKGYGFNLCRESKKKLLEALDNRDKEAEDISMYNTGGWD